jgi:beta-galactosidase
MSDIPGKVTKTISLKSYYIVSYILVSLILFLFLAAGCSNVTHAINTKSGIPNTRSMVNFNRDWKFAKGNHEGAEIPDFNDLAWEEVRLPHDWAISGPFNPNENGYAGKLPWRGVGWYRKKFTLEREDSDKRVYLDFDGVMAFPKVYINGELAGQWDYGYTSFRIDATPYVKFGGDNVISVMVDTRRQGTRWYPGSGIYRKVTMTICNPVHIAHWGTFVTTPELSDTAATVSIRSNIESHLDTESNITVEAVILDPDGQVVSTSKKRGIVPADGFCEVAQSLTVSEPQRWNIDSPKLYTAKTIVRKNNEVVDTDETTFGLRTFELKANDGFHLNGRRVQLYGVNLHHDHGPLGAAFYTRAMERQLEIMREMGCNAVRTSHNPPAPELLDLCDRMGFVVWDEVFDKWDDKAGRVRGEPPLKEYGEKHIRNFVMRDRNHPCVIVWSIGNEISNQPSDREGKSPERVKYMSDFVRKYDPTRPVGMACHIPNTVERPILDALDFTGWNYMHRYDRYRKSYPDKPIIYSESASTLSTRGFYELPHPTRKTEYSSQHQVDSYDLNAASWSDIPDVEFKLMEDDNFVAGEFVWTGFDYLGEPTPFSREAKSSYFGIVDLCGIPKDRFYLYRSYWRPETTTLHILPHWNWPKRIGKNVPVFVYTNGDSAELFLNDRSLGRRQKGAIPEKAENMAQGKPATASSFQKEDSHEASCANDADRVTRWCANTADTGQWWQVDLGEVKSIRYLEIDFEREEKNYGYEIKVSRDESTWETIITKSTSRMPRWGGPSQIFHDVDTQARYVRIEFTNLQEGAWASIKEFAVYPEKVESDYYDVTYKYRLRWNDVIYEPGELKAVSYKDGVRIGEAVMRTAGEPAEIRLTPDRKELRASGWDLCYILVEALDENDNLCPLADNLINFDVKGPVEIAGVGNGNPLSLEPFQADYRKLFHGKAMLILRTIENKTGNITVTATSDGLKQAKITVLSEVPM